MAYHRLAAQELIDSALFYDQRRAASGEGFLTEVDAVLEFIRAHPELGRPGRHGTRSYPTKRFPFRLVYEVQPEQPTQSKSDNKSSLVKS